jgi:multidrug resistance efflux pump
MISLGNGGAGLSLKALRRELAALQKRCTQLWAEMAAQEQEYVERKKCRAAATGAFKRYEALRDRYWAVEARRVELRGLIAERSRPEDDLP